MENKNFLFLTVLLFFSLSCNLLAAKSKQKDEVQAIITEDWQVLEWTDSESDYVTHYKIDIQQYNDKHKEYSDYTTLETEDNSTSVAITPQLKPGIYRYKITSYDLLGFEAVTSDWYDLKILQAFEPEVRNLSTNSNHTSTIYLEEINDGIFTVSGRNLFDLKEDENDLSYTKYFFKSNDALQKEYIPDILEHADNNRELKIHIDLNTFDIGSYTFVAQDASGLENEPNSDSQIHIRFKKLVDLDVAAGYILPVTLFDDTFKTYFNTPVRPLSATAKITFIPMKHTWGYLGLGVQGSYSRIFATYDTYKIDGNMITAMANFVYQKPVNILIENGTKNRHILTFEVHGGAGIVMLQNLVFHFPMDINSRPLNAYYIGADTGVSIQTYITNRLYIEVGADFIYAFMSDMQLGQILPYACVGFQF